MVILLKFQPNLRNRVIKMQHHPGHCHISQLLESSPPPPPLEGKYVFTVVNIDFVIQSEKQALVW